MADGATAPKGDEENQGALGGGDSGGASPLGLSDEEMMEMPLPELTPEPEPAPEPEPDPKDEDNADDDEDPEDGDEDPEDAGGNDDDTLKGGEDGDGDSTLKGLDDPDEDPVDPKDKGDSSEPADKGEQSKKAAAKEDLKAGETTADKKSEDSTKDDKTPDYKALYAEVMAPFKANGRDIKLDNPAEVRQMLQMGANYNKKMAALKPSMKILRKLENNGLLDEGKLDFLIDLDKKDPGAIQKLIKDSGMDPLNIDPDAKNDYKPKSYNVDDSEVKLAEVLDDIKGTETYQDTIKVVSTEWDESSKRVILEEPDIIRTINDHMASGVYGEIAAVMDKERMLGRLRGLSDIEAYKKVGIDMHEAGQFKSQATATPTPPPAKKSSAEAKAKTDKRKRAAGGSKSSPGKKGMSSLDPLAMTDEEIEKIGLAQFT